MEKIPTAEEVLNRDYTSTKENSIKCMSEFAKIHVEAALKEASEKAVLNMIPTTTFGKNYRKEILESYHLSNIK